MPENVQDGKQSASLPEVPKKYAPGELTAAEGAMPEYGFKNKDIPQHYKDVLKGLVQKVAQIDMFARIEEVKKAAQQRFYWRSMFSVYFNEGRNLWQSFDNVGEGDTGDIPLSYPFNIFQAYGRGFITQVGVVPSVRLEAMDPSNPAAARISAGADAMRRRIEFQNHVDVLAEQAARLFYTDGRVCFFNRWVCDGSRFGYKDHTHVEEDEEGVASGENPPQKQPREPKGGALMTPYGVLECKVPINMRDRADFPFFQLSFEIDLSAAKSMYPWIANTISGGQPGPGEYNFDRTTRIATTQGLRLLTQTGDTVAQLPTWQRTWLRPSYFSMVDEQKDREWLQNNYPDGCMVAFVGDTYAESRNESMDDHWEVCHPQQGDGQSTPSCGYLLMAVQDALNDCTDLNMEYLMKAIPAIIGDKNTFDFAAMSKQKAGPAARWPTKRNLEPAEKLVDKIWAEPKIEPPAFAQQFYQMLLTDIPQQLSGLYPSSLGDADPSNETKGGILALRDASRGQQGVAWKSFRRSYAASMEQLIRCEAYYRASEGDTVEVGSPGEDAVEVDLEDLHEGSFYCVPDGDESYPTTHEDIQQSFQALVTAALNGSQFANALINEPKNAIAIKDIVSIPGLVYPGADESIKQLEEISQLLDETPIPNLQAQQAWQQSVVAAAMAGQPPPPEPPQEQLLRPSVAIQRYDNDAIELKSGIDWVNSPEGQQARKENPKGFLNVELHLGMHEARIAQKTQADVMQKLQVTAVTEKMKHPATAPKSPAESINFKDLGSSGKIQVGAQAGLDLRADETQAIVQQHTPQPVEPTTQKVQ